MTYQTTRLRAIVVFHSPLLKFHHIFYNNFQFCTGIRSPLNQASAYLDSSQIYGTDTAEQHRLRAGFGGLKIIFLGRV